MKSEFAANLALEETARTPSQFDLDFERLERVRLTRLKAKHAAKSKKHEKKSVF